MSGHSHWATIKHKKEIVDARKGKLFSKISRLLMSAAREGGGNPETNLKLQYAIEKAREANMPRENIERAIKRGTGELPGTILENAIYEGFGPGNVAIMLEVITDNKNRTVSEIRKIFDTKGGKLGESNSVAWLFEKKGFFTIPADAVKEDELLGIALEAGAEDAELVGDIFEITCDPKDFEKIKSSLQGKGFQFQTAEITYVPKNYVQINNIETGRKIIELMESLQEHDDVQNVYSNFDIPNEILFAIEQTKGG